MSRDVITVGLTMRIPLLYQGEYSQWRERSKIWTAEEKKTLKIDRLARSLMIQGLSNDIYSKETAKDLCDALERQMRGSEYAEQDRKAAIFSSSTKETIVEVAYYTSESESESEFETSEYYDNYTNYGLFVNDNDDQEIFHDAIESASENFIENHIDSQKDYDKSEVDHNDSEEKEHLVDKLIRKFNHKIAKCQKRIEKPNQQSKDLENQNKDLQENYDVLINQVNTFEEQNNEFNEQIKVLNEKNAVLIAQTEVLQDQLKVKHVVIDTHTECQA
nr:hypothetical protein [Tanacetum cinerariifolium]